MTNLHTLMPTYALAQLNGQIFYCVNSRVVSSSCQDVALAREQNVLQPAQHGCPQIFLYTASNPGYVVYIIYALATRVPQVPSTSLPECPQCVSTRVPPVRLYPSAPSASLPEYSKCVSTRVVSTRVPPVCLYPSAPGAKYVSTRVPPVRLYPSTPSVLALCFCGIQNVNTESFTRRRLHIIASKEALKGLESV